MFPNLVFSIGTVEKKYRSRKGIPEDMIFLEKRELVAGHEPGLPQQIGRPDGPGAEAKV